MLITTGCFIVGAHTAKKGVSEIPLLSSIIDEWPMFRHDLYNTGYSTSSTPDDNSILWSKYIGDWVDSKPTLKDGRLYIVGDNYAGGDAYLWCLNPFNGSEIWSNNIPDDFIWGAPTVANDRVYVLGTYFYLYCFDADTGSLLWTFQAYGHCSPMVVDDKIYFGCSPGTREGFYCLNATTGDEIWFFAEGNYPGSTPAITDGKVFIGNGLFFYCLNAETGVEIWNISNSCYWSSPVVINDKVYINSDKFYCFDANTGDELWTYPIGSHSSSPAVAYGNVYVPTGDYGPGIVYALDAETGAFIWNSTNLPPIRNDATVADDKIYINSGSTSSLSKFICLDAHTGNIIWEYGLGGMYYMYSSAAVAYGNVYVGAGENGYIYAFGTPNEPPETPTEPDGPSEGEAGVEYTFSTSTTDPEEDDIHYLFNWGDGMDSGWLGPYASGATVNASHIWTERGDYEIRIKAHDGRRESDWSNPLTIHIIEENLPPDTPDEPSGETNGKINTKYTYTTSTVDPDGDQVYYMWNWGDGSQSSWLGPYDSGDEATADHTWTTKGDYSIKVKAKDINDAESDWSDPLPVTMPCSYNIPLHWFWEQLFERFSKAFPLLRYLIGF